MIGWIYFFQGITAHYPILYHSLVKYLSRPTHIARALAQFNKEERKRQEEERKRKAAEEERKRKEEEAEAERQRQAAAAAKVRQLHITSHSSVAHH